MELDVAVLLSIIGIVVAVVGVIIAYLQLRRTPKFEEVPRVDRQGSTVYVVNSPNVSVTIGDLSATATVVERSPRPSAVEDVIALGDRELEAKNYRTAIREYSVALASDPDNVFALNNRGSAYVEMGEARRGQVDLDKALRIDPKFASAWYNRGVGLAKQRKFKHALGSFLRAADLRVGYVQAHGMAGNCYQELGDYEQAILQYDRALEYSPQDPALLDNKGNSLSRQGRFSDAIDCYLRALRVNRGRKTTLNNYGVALLRMERFHDAIVQFDRAIQLDPLYAEPRYNKGLALGNLWRLNEAVECFSAAINVNPRYQDALVGRADAYSWLKQYERAIFDYKSALRLNWRIHGAHVGLGRALVEAGRGLESTPFFVLALVAHPKCPNSWLWLGILAHRVRLERISVVLFRVSVRWGPGSYFAWKSLGSQLGNLRKNRPALSALRRAWELHPHGTEAILDLAKAYIANGDGKAALELLEGASDTVRGHHEFEVLRASAQSLADRKR